MIELNTFYNLDCMEGMKEIPDQYFDLAIVDPPYGIGFDGQKFNQKTNRKEHKFKGWDSEIPNDSYFKELERVSKNQIIFGGNYMTFETIKMLD
jgi:site-specific DNA-methyltransferase (adenine-specific)